MEETLLGMYRKIFIQDPELIQLVERDMELPEPICLDIIEGNPDSLKEFRAPTYQMCMNAITIRPSSIKFSRYYDYELCHIAVSDSWENLKFIPIEHRSKELCIEALDQDIQAARHCPHQDVLIDRVGAQPEVLEYCEIQTFELCIEAVRKNYRCIGFIRSEEVINQIQNLL